MSDRAVDEAIGFDRRHVIVFDGSQRGRKELVLVGDTILRRQGALFQIVGRTKDAELVSAAASALHPDSGLPPQEQPFLRAMMHHTLENGFVRLMAEAMESGPFRSPLNFLSDDDDFYF